MYPALADDVSNQVFAADLVAQLPMLIKGKLTAFDEAARMAVPMTESFEGRMGLSAQQPLCIAQLGAWASAAKIDKADFKKPGGRPADSLCACGCAPSGRCCASAVSSAPGPSGIASAPAPQVLSVL